MPSTIENFPSPFWGRPSRKIENCYWKHKTWTPGKIKKTKTRKKSLEAKRLEQRTSYDLEMIKETGYCHGIENYSRHLEFRKPGEPPFTLLDYFPKDFLVFIDESHQTLLQLQAMTNQDQTRKKTLIEYGFRLPSAIDNRPLTFKEFEKKIKQVIYVSATPNEEERKKAGKNFIVEQLIRPTGLLEPSIEIRPTKNQVKGLVKEIKKRVKKSKEF